MPTINQNGFIGFPDAKMKPVVVPDHFFTELLPLIEDLGELKLTLHCFWLLNEQERDIRYVRGRDLRSDERLLQSLSGDSELRTPPAALEDALQRAVARNTLLKLEIETEDERNDAQVEDWYFMNTVKGRQTVALIRQGKISSHDLAAAIPSEARLKVERPNVFVMYEQNIGFMTPMIADQLRDLEKTYAPDWIEEAFEISVSRNKRSLRYIQAILKRWESEGKGPDSNEETRRDTPEQRDKYRPDKYSDIILG